MGLRDDTEDAPGKEPVVVRLTPSDQSALYEVIARADKARKSALYWERQHNISAPVEAALHDFSLGLDELIKETLGKVRDDQ